MPEQTSCWRTIPTIPKLTFFAAPAITPQLGKDGCPTSRSQKPEERRHKEVMAWKERKHQEPQRQRDGERGLDAGTEGVKVGERQHLLVAVEAPASRGLEDELYAMLLVCPEDLLATV